ncbi:hypothetical protein KAR29_04965 [Aminithiophilus ramosus]|uniref:Uncharacterized protein n=1 Tax=Aminithiophilus ramosus TaxID=3029084 RepID=A0A9Q7ASP5_9BACT|nr:hypothetical protein [Aminithiophilus ramosus]QTX33246.1 hypothetical protein KAR29_04965 [Aminithiophilus ramosus]
MSSANFTITFEGFALENHEMDIRALAPALLAVNNLIEEASDILNDKHCRVTVNVKAGFKTGSFGVDLSIGQIVTNAISFLNSESVIAAVTLCGLLGLTVNCGKGLVPVVKWLRERSIRLIRNNGDGTATITTEDGDSEVIDERIVRLLEDLEIRQALEKAIKVPLEEEGIERIRFESDKGESATISKSEAPYFRAPTFEGNVLLDSTKEIYLKPLSISFLEGNKWRFSDGAQTFFATIRDEVFVGGIQQGEISFSKGDLLKVLLRTIQREDVAGFKTEHEVLEVIEHKKTGRQLRFPIDDGKS